MCGINPLTWSSCVGNAIGGAVGGLASAGFQAISDAFAAGVGKIVSTLATFWTAVPTTNPDARCGGVPCGPVAVLSGMLSWVMLIVGVLSILLVAARMAITQRGDALTDGATGLARFVLINSAQVPAIGLLAVGGDLFSAWILNQASGGNFGARVTTVFGTSLAGGTLGMALVFIVSILAMLASIAQLFMMVARNGVLILTAAMTPVAGAAAIFKGNESMWRKLWMWQLAFVLYKPVAAFIYATAFIVITDSTSAIDQLSGMALLVMSVLALPALLRLMMPVAASMGGGGGGGGLAAGAVAASGVASVMAAKGRGGGGGGGGGGGATPSGGFGPQGGPSGSAGAATSGAGAGAGAGAAAGGPAGAAVMAGLQVAGAAKKAAEGAAGGAASGTGV